MFLDSTWVDGDKKKDVLIRRASSLFGNQTDHSNETMHLVPHKDIPDSSDIGLIFDNQD
jgi:hypothetical protein